MSDDAEEAKRRAERTERLLTLLRKALCHELPNQLLGIQGLARLLDMDESARLSAEGKDYLARIAAGAQRTHELVRILADLVRTGQTPVPKMPLPVRDMVQQVAAELKPLCPDRLIEYHFPAAEILLSLPGAAWRQVVVHLLRNAHQAAAPERPLRITVGARATNDSVEFWVTDTGRGLTAEQQQRLFEPFAGRAAGMPGTGLGLILVRHLVDGWGGRLNVQSTPGQGSTFTVTLPQARKDDRGNMK